MNVKCQCCGHVHESFVTIEVLTTLRCPQCNVAARLVQVPMGRTTNGQHDQPGMPRNMESYMQSAMTTAQSIAASNG